MDRKRQLLNMYSGLQTALRKKKQGNGTPITVADVRNPSNVQEMVSRNEAYSILSTVRSSPEYWRKEKTKLLSMVRQFGLPTFFVTLSAAETQWGELLVILKQVVDGQEITLDEANQLEYREKARLIREDPVTCARYFDHRFKELKKTWKSSHGPFPGKILHYYHRIEFQQRGSPHVHMLLWIKDAPLYVDGGDNEGEVCTYIDQVISCNTDYLNDEVMMELLERQRHHHTRTCKKKNRPSIKCRFNIPFMPMDQTRILKPLDEDMGDDQIKKIRDSFKIIMALLESDDHTLYSGFTFDQFILHLNMTLDDYLLAVRSSIQATSKIFLKRAPCDVYINSYSRKILELHRANMDIQYILDVYACCAYVVDYINKADRGMSDMLDRAYHEVNNGNQSVTSLFTKLSNIYYNHSEVSAQEAAYNLLWIPMVGASEKNIYVNTSPPEERTHIIKSKTQLAASPDDSTDCFVDGVLDHYIMRPTTMEATNLAQFAAWYEYFKKASRNASVNSGGEVDEDIGEFSEDEVDPQSNPYTALKENSGYIRRRKNPKVIRFRRYKLHTDPLNYYREQLMLYVPWRNEDDDLLNDNVEQLFYQNVEHIIEKRGEFNHLTDLEIDEAMERANENAMDRQEVIQENESRQANEFHLYALNDPQNLVNILSDTGEYERRAYSERFVPPNRLNQGEYESLVSKLNDQQRNYVYHVLHSIRNNDTEPFYHFVTGGAGTGKSLLINVLYQGLIRLLDDGGLDRDREKPSVLLCAPTGMAAFNISGQTNHSVFHLPANRGKDLPALSADVSNSMATHLADVKIVIIDEISMVSSEMFIWIHRRLSTIFSDNRPFGGKSIIVVGDLNQLPPVMGSAIYKKPTNDPHATLFGGNLWENFVVHRLTTIMRQQDDLAFAMALNSMATGTMTTPDINLMQSRAFTSPPQPSPGVVPIHLFYRNLDVSTWNNIVLDGMDTDGDESLAFDSVGGDGNPRSRQRILETVANLKSSDTMGLPLKVKLKVGARYMVTSNIDTGDGLVNGVTGILKQIDRGIHIRNESRTKPLRVWLELSDIRCGQKLRRRSAALIRELRLPDNWTPITPFTTEIKRMAKTTLHVIRTQFPLVPAEAITIHKSQGATYQSVVVHADKRINRSLLYVGCSRATSAAGLAIVDRFTPPNPRSASDSLHLELCRQNSIQLTTKFSWLHSPRNGQMQLILHNIQSMAAHLDLVRKDSVYLNSDILLFVETWSIANQEYPIDGFLMASRSDCDGSVSKAMGSCCYVGNHLNDDIGTKGSNIVRQRNGVVSVAWVIIQDILVVSIYASPNTSVNNIIESLEAIPSWSGRKIFAGDFNINTMTRSRSRQELLNFFAHHNCTSALPPNLTTTTSNTQIDNIFTSFPIISVGHYFSISPSPHIPIYLRF
jgi:hypothetical protein